MILVLCLVGLTAAELIDRVDVTTLHVMPLTLCDQPSTWSSWNITEATAWIQLGSDFDLSELSSLVVKTKVGYSDFQQSAITYSAPKYNLIGISLPFEISRNLIVGSSTDLSIKLNTATKDIRPVLFSITPNPVYKVKSEEECTKGSSYVVTTSSIAATSASLIVYPSTSPKPVNLVYNAPVSTTTVPARGVYAVQTSSLKAYTTIAPAEYTNKTSPTIPSIHYPIQQSSTAATQIYKVATSSSKPSLVYSTSTILKTSSSSPAPSSTSASTSNPPARNPELKSNAYKNSYILASLVGLLYLVLI